MFQILKYRVKKVFISVFFQTFRESDETKDQLSYRSFIRIETPQQDSSSKRTVVRQQQHPRQKRHVRHRGFIRHFDHTYGGHHHGNGDGDDDEGDDEDGDEEDGYRRSSGRDVAHLSYETEKYGENMEHDIDKENHLVEDIGDHIENSSK